MESLTVRTMAPKGATQDLFLRALQPILAQRFGLSLEIENAPGQDGVLVTQKAKGDPPDGRHLLVTTPAALTFYPQADAVGFDATDFDPLLGVGRFNFVVITRAMQPWADLQGALSYMREQGRPLRYAGTGQPDLLMLSAIAASEGIKLEFLQRTGSALLETVMSGEADIGLGTGTHQPLLTNGQVRVVAALHPRAKDTELTPQSFGVPATLDYFLLISAPAGLSSGMRASLVAQLGEAAASPSIQDLLTQRLLMEPGLLLGRDLADAMNAQTAAFAKLRAQCLT